MSWQRSERISGNLGAVSVMSSNERFRKTDLDVDPPAIAKVGAQFTRRAGEFTCEVDTFATAAQIPASAVGPIGPGQDALKAYQELLAHVSEHLQNLREAMDETGSRLGKSAANYEKMERANTLPCA